MLFNVVFVLMMVTEYPESIFIHSCNVKSSEIRFSMSDKKYINVVCSMLLVILSLKESSSINVRKHITWDKSTLYFTFQSYFLWNSLELSLMHYTEKFLHSIV